MSLKKKKLGFRRMVTKHGLKYALYNLHDSQSIRVPISWLESKYCAVIKIMLCKRILLTGNQLGRDIPH